MAIGVNAFWEERISSVRTAFGSTGSDDVALGGLTLGRNETIANNHFIVANSGESQHRCPSRRSPSSPQNPTRGGSRRSNPRPQLVVTATSCWRFVHLVVNACSDFPSRCDNIKPRAGDGAGDGNRTRVLNLGISHRCESSVIEDGGLVTQLATESE